MPMSANDRFLEYVSPEPNTGCWLWAGAVGSDGRGLFRLGSQGSPEKAHRAAWKLLVGPIPTFDGHHGMCICHRCDNPICVNPAHLFLGTQLDNMRDMNAKGRNGRTKLTGKSVASIRALAGHVAQCDIAEMFSVTQGVVSKIIRRATWRHVN